MYFPYLRGKQFELLALRDLAPVLAAARDKISPIIEPVKSSSGLRTALKAMKSCGVNLNIVFNPTVGDFSKRQGSALGFLSATLQDFEDFQTAIIVDANSMSFVRGQLLDRLKSEVQRSRGFTFIHNEVSSDIKQLLAQYATYQDIRFNVVNFRKTSRRYYREFGEGTCVSLDDYFLCLDKNAAYLAQDESQFSDEHLYYKDEGFVGFSDFLTIGDNYSDSGFLPYAVAIHISYADENKHIRVKHFVSHTNEDTTDVAGKFAEAVEKLVLWCRSNRHNTMAIRTFEEYYEKGHFPGLGTIKKLSLMNHIELVLSLI